MKRYGALALFCLALPALFAGAAEDSLENSVVQVSVTFQESDPFMPWRMREPSGRWGYGVAIGADLVLTTEQLVRNSTHIELRKATKGEKFAAVVEQADYQANMALLKVRTKDAAGALVPLEIAGNLPASNDLEMVQFDETDKMQRGKARLITTSVANLPSAPYPSLTFSVLTDLNVDAPGSPLLAGGKLAGLVMQFEASARTATVLPYPVLRKFVDDATTPPYEGVASAGFIWRPLVDPAKKAYLKVPKPDSGVIVVSTIAGTGASGVLKPEDAIVQWDGHDIDNLGFYNDPDWGRLSLPYLIKGRRKPGDAVPVTIVRGGKEESVSVKLARQSDGDSLIPDNIENKPEAYVVEGGLIIRELTGRYLRSHSDNWMMAANPKLVHLYLTRAHCRSNELDRVVILSGVLSDPINVGYEEFDERIIETINNKPVRNMGDVFAVLASDGNIERVRMKSFGVDLVLDRSQIKEANERISRYYRIAGLRHNDTKRN